MASVTLEQARENLERLIDRAATGEEVIIMRDSEPLAKIVSAMRYSTRPVFGSAKAVLVHMADDFNAPLEEFREYME